MNYELTIPGREFVLMSDKTRQRLVTDAFLFAADRRLEIYTMETPDGGRVIRFTEAQASTPDPSAPTAIGEGHGLGTRSTFPPQL